MHVRWSKVTIIGVGLLGGSIGMTLRKRSLAGECCGYVRREAAIREVLRAGAVHVATTDLIEAVAGADLIILCTPIVQMEGLVQQMIPGLKKSAIVTDVGSVKGPLITALGSKLRDAGTHFVGSHPMAGSERGGVRSARSDLFDGAVCVITPASGSPRYAVDNVRKFWKSLGARVLTMDAVTHDKLVSGASHLPHLIASLLTVQVLDARHDKRQAILCATGFRDTTRVASGSPEMWRDISLANRKNLIRDLNEFERRLVSLRGWLAKGDLKRLEQFLKSAHKLRSNWNNGRMSTSQE